MKKKTILFFTILIILATGGSFLFFKYTSISRPANIILITPDALRSDHLSCYGYKRETSPNIDRLAREGAMFTQAISHASWTIPSFPSIMTSTYQNFHHIYDFGDDLDPSIYTMAQIMHDNDYYTSAICEHGGPVDEYSMPYIKKGFDIFLYESKDKVSQSVIKWLEKNQYKKFFLWIYYLDPHIPYTAPSPYDRMFDFGVNSDIRHVPIASEALPDYVGAGVIPRVVAKDGITDVNFYISQYDGEIGFVDEQIGSLLKKLKELELDKKTLIILTSDHGELLGEHDHYFEHIGLYDEVLRVPLIIKYPEVIPRGKVVTNQLQSVDILPTILDVLNIRRNRYPQIQGISALPLIFAKDDREFPYAFSVETNADRRKLAYAVRTKKWKLVQYGDSCQLYNLAKDPGELNNIADEEKEQFQLLKKVLEEWKSKARPYSRIPRAIDDETKDKLRSLGYLQ